MILDTIENQKESHNIIEKIKNVEEKSISTILNVIEENVQSIIIEHENGVKAKATSSVIIEDNVQSINIVEPENIPNIIDVVINVEVVENEVTLLLIFFKQNSNVCEITKFVK